MSWQEHQAYAVSSVTCAVITVSDTRTEATDTSGSTIRDLLSEHGHQVCHRTVVPDEPARIREEIMRLGGRPDCQAILLTGGTGIAPRDCTTDTVAALLDRRLEGFGELFRLLSFEEIGPAAMLSGALGGVRGGQLVFCMPGSTAAVRLAMTRLILPVLPHMAAELRRSSRPDAQAQG